MEEENFSTTKSAEWLWAAWPGLVSIDQWNKRLFFWPVCTDQLWETPIFIQNEYYRL